MTETAITSTKVTPEILWHYTTSEALLEILKSGAVFATAFDHMNDASELAYAYQLLESVSLSRICQDESEKEQIRGLVLAGPRPIHRSEDLHREGTLCLFCLSNIEDSLEQWRGYGGASGVAIGFRSGALKAKAANDSARFRLVECVYPEPDEFPPFLEDLVTRFLRERGHGYTLDYRIELKRLGTSVKHWKFRAEQEWRLVSDFIWPRELELRSSRARVVPYKRVKLVDRTESAPLPQGWAGLIQRVCVGPGRYKELTFDALQKQLEAEHIKVVASQIPYRDLY